MIDRALEIMDSTIYAQGGLDFAVDIIHDDSYSPSNYTTELESPELWAAWRNGDVRYVGVLVTPVIGSNPLHGLHASIWGVGWGTCEGWPRAIGTAEILEDYLPDLIAEVAQLMTPLAINLRQWADFATVGNG